MVAEATVNDARLEPAAATDERMSLKLYFSGTRVALSESLPVIERFGLKVADYRSIPCSGAGGAQAWVDHFILAEESLDWIKSDHIQLEEALRSVWRGEAESDDFCRITTQTGLSWQAVVVFRAYSRYLRQIGFPIGGGEIAAALGRNGAATLALMRLFETLFDPDFEGERAAVAAQRKDAVLQALGSVERVEDDRILRQYLMLIEATLRTNYFQRSPDGQAKPYLSFKLDSRALEGLPLPRPLVEIFVYSPRTEGIHLRGGKVARGGIRWSDRHADFRTEIHGLLKAQMVKNVVIVPEGSKGGFVVKQPPAGGGEALRQEAVACYQTLIRGMLDLTDNIAADAVVPPRRVVRRDGDDPYLVVAADKGTATFSDVANRISAEYGFWLGDAFASGGSVGYDHKKIGITARGAWESVRRHFREMGQDIQTEEFTVVGVGDMSGDVFGNGMLLSPKIRLIGAFDHRHIFLDPNADAARAYRERQRLFKLPRSSWADYAASELGAGGGVFERSARSITLSEAAREMLDLPSVETTPNAVISALLKAAADLLWLGGIGTYVKASTESHEQVGDRSCDAVRVDAAQLRCRVVGEGANLGFTQRARIEYALGGGRINTDAIDNAGGVNCSDHEVNIKILFERAIKAGKLDRQERDALLASMTDEVAGLVLRDNYLQSQALSMALANAPAMIDTHQRLMQYLARSGHLDRKVAALPDDEELKSRRSAGLGLTRPELAVLLAYTKVAIYAEVIRSRLPDDPLFARDLVEYFPTPLQGRFAAEIDGHPLRREIVATMVVNGMVNRVGSGFVNDLQEKTGRSDDEVMRAYAVVRDVFGLEKFWAAVEGLDGKVAGATQVALLLGARKLVEASTLWVLRNVVGPIDVSAAARRLGARVPELIERLPELLGADRRADYAARLNVDLALGVPADLARFHAAMRDLECALDVTLLAEHFDMPVEKIGRLYFSVDEALGLPLLKTSAAAIPCRDALESVAVTGLVDQLGDSFVHLVGRITAEPGFQTGDGGAAFDDVLAAQSYQKKRLETLTGDLRRGEAPSLALLVVANQSLAAIAGG
ncbi:MAG: NAD-glutamate dehydrogenase [Betaproteobacteria bacterium]|nr:NAD-glutamate dehydrogenase [Betaproteobacteria bacterium]